MISTFTYVCTQFKKIIFISLLFFIASNAKAQVIVSEGFDQPSGNSILPIWPANNLPFGWGMGRGNDVNAYWDRMNNPGVLPPCSPHGGTAMVRCRTAYNTTANDASYIVSKPFDLSARPSGVTSNVRFWIYRDANSGIDNIQIYANNVPDPTTGAPAALADTTFFVTSIPRCYTSAPAVGSAGWYLYGFTIPANTYSISNLYISIKVTHGPAAATSNVYIDDFSITTYPSAQVFNTLTLDFQNTNPIGQGSSGNIIIGMRVNVSGSATPLSVGNFQFLPNGCTQANPYPTDVSNTKLWWTGGSTDFNPLTAIQIGSYAGPMSPSWNISGAALTALDNGNNYFWLTYDVPNGAGSNDCVDAGFLNAIIGGVSHSCGTSGCSLPGCRMIAPWYCVPVYSAGTSGLNNTYTNNDYVKWVQCAGDPAYPPGINNDHNDVPAGVLPVGAGYPGDPCVTSAGQLAAGGASPFSAHPFDYENFPVATVPALCPTGGGNRTAVFLESSVTPPTYNISVQCGTYPGANCIAAWMDFNHDGVFNNNMWNLGGEKLVQSGYMNALTFINGNFTIPVTGYYGPTTLRVREWYGNNNMDPCSPGYYGETEDYTVTLRHDCSPLYPGWKTWLGYTDEWNVSTNWCGGVPTINDNALIPGKGSQSFNRQTGSYHPVIKSGVLATTKKLVLINDTVEINAPVAGSLRISDSLDIKPNSLLKVDSSNVNTATVLNGGFTDNTFSPLRAGLKEQKMQMIFKTSEITGQGLTDGDVIDEIWIPIRIHGSSTGFNYPVQINMYYADSTASYAPSFWNTGFSGVVPVTGSALAPANTSPVVPNQPIAIGPYPVDVYSGNINLTSQLGAGIGTYHVVLQKPFSFYSTNGYHPLIIEICYELPVTSVNDQVWQNQTTSYRSVLLLANATNALGAGCSFTNGGGGMLQKLSSTLRPNLIFKYHRVYEKFPINLETNGATTSNWKNSGNFIAGNSKVTFMGTTIQYYGGANSSSFYDLTINNPQGLKIYKSFTVADSLNLKSGKLNLNSNSISVLNSGTGGIVRTSGAILSETVPPNYGMVNWTIGTVTGAHVFPFQTSTGNYIPLTYNLTTGDVGIVHAATYPTPVSNLPYPTAVTNINDAANANDSSFTLDRFWHINKTGPSGKAKIIFTYQNSEAPAPIVNGNIIAQRYNFSNNKWVLLPYTMTNSVGASTSQVLVTGVTGNNLSANVWALSDAVSPLRMSEPEESKIEVAPNPFSDKIILSLHSVPANGGNISLNLYNMLGEMTAQTIIPADLISANAQFEWNTGDIKNGIYFLVIKSRDEIRTERVVRMGE